MNTLLPYLIVNTLLLLIAIRYYGQAQTRFRQVIETCGSLRPWLSDHREVSQQYQEARFLVMLLGLKELGL
jgi:hypothetical protein